MGSFVLAVGLLPDFVFYLHLFPLSTCRFQFPLHIPWILMIEIWRGFLFFNTVIKICRTEVLLKLSWVLEYIKKKYRKEKVREKKKTNKKIA